MQLLDERDWLAKRFEECRPHLRSVAFRILGSPTEADDAVQDAWLRLSCSDASGILDLRGWLTTAVARSSLNILQSRRSRREEPFSMSVPEPILVDHAAIEPEHEALLAESVGLAFLVVLERLTPAERVAFVLHDVFAVPFEVIGEVVGRSTAAARQLASRARRGLQAAPIPDADLRRHRLVVDAFLVASRSGDFETLLALLDPDAVVRADRTGVKMGANGEVRGAASVAQTFLGRSHDARPALVNGAAGAVWAPRGKPRVVLSFTIRGGKIVKIDLIADPGRLAELDLVLLDA